MTATKEAKYDKFTIRSDKENEKLVNKTNDWKVILTKKDDTTTSDGRDMLKNFRIK